MLNRWLKRKRGPVLDATPDRPIAFENKIVWIAVPSQDAQAVAEGLELRGLEPANWESGLQAAVWDSGRKGYRHVFVAPAVNGWTLAIGFGLPDPTSRDEAERCSRVMGTLSERFGQAQYFASHRVSHYYAWVKFVGGKRVRGFVSGEGDTMLDEGEPTAVEGDLLEDPDEEAVLKVAEDWGLGPLCLEDFDTEPAVGLVGRF